MKIITVSFDEKYAPEIKNIRSKVFTSEQNIDPNMDFDGQDHDAVHVLIRSDDKYVGTGRMLNDGHIGRLAVLKEYRGKGLGAEIIISLIKEARKNNLKRVYLGAQSHAITFYEKLGFSKHGKAYIEVNIEHVNMEKII
ncbi:GNAT family N-acetyltransferase [Pseudoalteromonas sp. DL-6]|uniref:GNAT family N-acetyltransferase n=1 Tax=Pseudoalteromonas sp. DL-6 TaxID=1390185 RepID=UPI00103A011A|nr:GNAT family N-acetyltransferase [Pseudoalteromonas sp. DL-6]QBJ63695.1 GNAT family N-acetyltransferase [Pseudoalteromonas sp. DL-6]